MFLELVATFLAGIAAAGGMMLINRLLGGRLPRWLTPVAAGCAMIAATISNEYGWYDRTRDSLPAEFAVVQVAESRAMYRPWTYLQPFVERFMAVDQASVQTNTAVPDQRLADLYFFGRWSPVRSVPVLIDCVGARLAQLGNGASFGANGVVENVTWAALPSDHPLLLTLCKEGA